MFSIKVKICSCSSENVVFDLLPMTAVSAELQIISLIVFQTKSQTTEKPKVKFIIKNVK
jgi:hypothetical protein